MSPQSESPGAWVQIPVLSPLHYVTPAHCFPTLDLKNGAEIITTSDKDN